MKEQPSDKARDECGIVGVYNLDPESDQSVTPYIPSALLDLQHRGQLAAGMTRFDPTGAYRLLTHKDTGSVREVFRLTHRAKARSIVDEHAGVAAIGHVRYATSGRDQIEYAQPFTRHHSRTFKWFALGFNGNLANYAHLRDHLTKVRGYHMVHDVDTEILLHHVAHAMRGDSKPALAAAFRELTQNLDGAYNIMFLNADGDLVAARDPLGFRPLCFGVRDDLFVVASESVALRNMGIEEIVDVEPGQMVRVDYETRTVHLERYAEPQGHHHCFFEWVYFAHVSSVMEGRTVYDARWRLGENLARNETETMDEHCVVVAVPDTAKPIGDAFAFSLRVPSLEGIVRNRYVGRTFIEGEGREQKVRSKYTLLPSVTGGKRVFLVEDSLVRSTTLRDLVKRTRDEGQATEVHVRIGAPPVIAPCFYGIDMSTLGELFAPAWLTKGYTAADLDRVSRDMAAHLGADSLRYLPVADVAPSIGLPHQHLCTACVTADYPSTAGESIYDQERANGRERSQGRSTDLTADIAATVT
ncbi:MAG TPA: amidophosphoribosyltransferase [Candidatus Latescibacteria bacterium]|nr:amidophosphoribosyltransferase [Gemmatimonadaceae bacterium]MDP6015422.1 amidophosphoribosyltransferase [Candidatus Latescibacterota bacterium]HJP32583.1 amidophosphoribosyltransferase [Candidatus Latescibacterota bacterium]